MTKDAKKSAKQRFSLPDRQAPWILLFCVTILFTLLLYPDLITTTPEYRLGDVAEHDVKASVDFFIEDQAATEQARQRAVEGVLTVYDHNTAMLPELLARVTKAFTDVRREMAAAKKAEDAAEQVAASGSETETPAPSHISPDDRAWQLKETFEQTLGIDVNKGAYTALVAVSFDRMTADLISRILKEILENGVVANKEILLREGDKGVALRSLGTDAEKVVFNLKRFYGLDQAQTMVRVVGQPLLKDVNYNLVNLIVDFCQRLIQPNITLNRSETEERKKTAALAVKPTLYKIKAGEMILREGERITRDKLIKLETLKGQIQTGRAFTTGVGAAMIVLCLLITAYMLHFSGAMGEGKIRNLDLLFVSCILVLLTFMARISGLFADSLASGAPMHLAASSLYYGIPMATGPMIVCLFLGLGPALAFALVSSVFTSLLFSDHLLLFIYFFISGAMAAYWIQDCRERKVFIKAGLKISMLNMVLALSMDVYTNAFTGFTPVWDLSCAFLGGAFAGIFTAGLAPLMEVAFDYTSDIKLLELANLDRPILRRLMLEAPGTYHHSVIVGTMVEAAASEIGANPLLGKVCGYYHDIGKINKPLYFIENQYDGDNKHDRLAPSMSSLILISHVKEGVEMARKHKLGSAIIDTIRQHHGTSLIRYFYEKARQLKGDDQVNIAGFRYPGPKPQSREAGLVMLADVVEAASRTLENPTPSRIQGLVQNLISKIFSDGQLDECELTLKDLHNIAKSYNKILTGIHHHRIEYAESNAPGNGKAKNGSPDRQPAKTSKDAPSDDKEKGRGSLKRLGLS